MSSLTESVYREAATLPLKDAAFELWRYKYNFDSEELPPRPPVDLSDPEVSRHFTANFNESYRREREQAHDGIMFDRMKRVHPRASDADLKQAIKAAVKLHDDCDRYFDRDYADFAKAVEQAVAKARLANPGFLETTYRSAESNLLFLWK